MPISPPVVCSTSGCANTATKHGKCGTHYTPKKDARTRSSTQRGYNGQWRKIRKIVLGREPLCRFCYASGVITTAEVVDHIDGNSSNNNLVNLRPLCKRCHDKRTGRDQGYFSKSVRLKNG